ncbi:probable leucine-rich repeat receptor-like protein kinase At1g68400 [Phragmites australis]|uniref:probable leucine-rich repeat receptor-like protein kinase At1g68400 n=1 Tax=Phragmites australis TaxID=29695 RepID=UPI002D7737F3|nr:probable leucine-rich repeat receptor-like protein kinase At1g68400 [Phragmites australis]
MPPNGGTALLLLLLPPLLLHCLVCFANAGSLQDDVAALSEFRLAADQSGTLASWNLSEKPLPCETWRGVTCAGGRVTRLVLEGLGLSGAAALPALARLDGLRVLSLKGNILSGEIPDFSPLAGLKLLFLAKNSLSGPIPTSLGALYRLYRLDLSFNNLSGVVPPEMNRLDRLLTLRLDSNRLTGGIDAIALPRLQEFNVSNNLMSGRIPAPMAGFPAAAFGGNVGLCSAPLAPCKDEAQQPNASAAVNASAAGECPPAAAMVASSPSAKPDGAETPGSGKGRMSRAAVGAIVAGDFAVVGLVAGLLFCYFWPRLSGRRSGRRLRAGEKIVYSSSPYGAAGVVAAAGGTFERGKMVFLEDIRNNGGTSDTRRFELEELLRASAEMLGKGACGTAYKAVLDDGTVVAVKRLRDATAAAASKKDFEHQMAVLGRLRHPNIVPLNAYYYARDEKLLVYEFMPNGCLFSLLHGNRGPGRTPLEWAARLRIASGAARGLAYIHHAGRQGSGTSKLAHGNIKSTNILLDKAGVARLADCGLAQLGSSPAAAAARSAGYRAPEAPPPPRPWASHKGDVYAFGVVLLELLTGRCPGSELPNGGVVVELPRWVQSVVREEWTSEVFDLELMKDKGIEEEMVAMLQLALSCASAAPGQRPKIGYVVKMIDEIRAFGEASSSHESMDESSGVSDSPAVSEGGAVSQ